MICHSHAHDEPRPSWVDLDFQLPVFWLLACERLDIDLSVKPAFW